LPGYHVLSTGWISTRLITVAMGLVVVLGSVLLYGGNERIMGIIVGSLFAVGACLWAARDVVLVTPTKLVRGLKSVRRDDVYDLALRPIDRSIAPNLKPVPGHEIVALTEQGEWSIGLFSRDLGANFGGIHPRLQAKLAALRSVILK
jgi:hypothetical protein